jgi:hypothetical protein
MTVHTCTRCPLRFPNRAELADHLEHDHHVPHHLLEQLSYPGAAQAEPLYRSLVDDDVHTVLVIANQTLGSDVLAQAMGELKRQHDRLSAYVLVPATPSVHLATAPGGGMPASPASGLDARTDDVGVAQARWRLRTAVAALADLGIAAHGSVGDPNPVTAAATVIASEPIDEILVSTLDPTTSRWLRADLPAALGHRFGLPVRTLSVTSAA